MAIDVYTPPQNNVSTIVPPVNPPAAVEASETKKNPEKPQAVTKVITPDVLIVRQESLSFMGFDFKLHSPEYLNLDEMAKALGVDVVLALANSELCARVRTYVRTHLPYSEDLETRKTMLQTLSEKGEFIFSEDQAAKFVPGDRVPTTSKGWLALCNRLKKEGKLAEARVAAMEYKKACNEEMESLINSLDKIEG